jgi:hypothetical protein
VNFPKLHIDNGERKNVEQRTAGRYKDLVRIFKNLRNRIEEEYGLERRWAPSYFIEGLVYNVPDALLAAGQHRTAFEQALDYLLTRAPADQLVTPSHQHPIFGQQPWQWSKDEAARAVTTFRDYYVANRA